jgi:hypothetical protein
LFDTLSKGEGVLELDGASWDASVVADSLFDICEWRCEYLPDDKDKQRLRTLYDNVANSVFVLWDGSLVKKKSGLATGFTNTLVDNTLHNIRFALYTLYRKYGKDTESVMDKFVGRFFGDDSVMTWTGLDLDYPFFRECGKEMGLDMTCTLNGLSSIWEAVFVGGQFCSRTDGNVGYLPNIRRSIASLAYFRKPHNPEKYLSRVAGLRLNTFGSENLFKVVDEISMDMLHAYERVLVKNGLWKQVNSYFLSKENLYQLHFGDPTAEVKAIAEALTNFAGGKYVSV